ncbi:MAG: hypothetical protein PVF15_09725 [Candidatus Bathyarchaeota archaeon]|jgi:hypothetical protein
MKRVVGLFLLILGISLLLLSFLDFSRTDTVIDTAFTLEPGEKFGPREDGTGTRYSPPDDCVLKGKVSVEGEGIYVTVQGLGYEIENIFVDRDFNFTIDPAHGWDHIYFFTFDNTDGDAESHVEFVLEETLTESLVWGFLRSWRPSPILGILGWLGILLLFPVGFILTFGSLFSKKKE